MALSVNWATKVITVPQADLTHIGGASYQLDTFKFKTWINDLEDSEEGSVFPPILSHNTVVTIGGIQYARTLEIINGYTVTFEDTGTPYKVFLIGSNNNILDVTNLNNVSVAPSNSAGLINVTEVQEAAFDDGVTIDVSNTTGRATSQTTYPGGTQASPIDSLAGAMTIAGARGYDKLYLVGNLTIDQSVANMHLWGQGATLNVTKTLITLAGGSTSNSWYHGCKITGAQAGESHYIDCIIDGLSNAHCEYIRCGLLDGTALGYTIQQSSGSSVGHVAYCKDCYSDEGTAIIDRNGTKMNMRLDGFSGNIKFINQNRAYVSETDRSGEVWIRMEGGTITIDASCTTGKITLSGNGTLVNNSGGTEVDTTAFTSEGFDQVHLAIESGKQTHQAFGHRFFVDPVNGLDTSRGTFNSPVKTVAQAINLAVSGRGDAIYLLAPGAGAVTIDERVVINKEDIHIRGPGRGIQFQPSTPNAGPVIDIQANNCSLSGFLLRTPVGSTTDDGITVSGKFSRMEKLYLVGPGKGVGTGRGVVFTAGDYHELIDMEIEKFGDSGIELEDLNTANGSPREITISGGNIYLNGEHGVCIHGRAGAAVGTTSRIIRLVNGVNIHDNDSYGVHSEANVQGVMIDNSVIIHHNNGGHDQPQTLLESADSHYESTERAHHTAKEVWEYPVADAKTVAGSVGEYIAKKLVTFAQLLAR